MPASLMGDKAGAGWTQNADDRLPRAGAPAAIAGVGARIRAMGITMWLDAAIAAPAVILGLLGVWLGFARSSVAWPMRWLLPLLGAYAAGRIAQIGVLVVWEVAELLNLVGPPVTWPAFAVAFLATLVPLLMFMDTLINRVVVWTAGRPTGLGERVLGGLFGTACGLALVAAAIEHSPIRRATADEPA